MGAKFYEEKQDDIAAMHALCALMRAYVRVEFPGGQKTFYEGKKGVEHYVRSEFPSGQKNFYFGKKRAERQVRVEFPNGAWFFYEGEKGAERVVRTEPPPLRRPAQRQRIAALAVARGSLLK